MNRFKKYVKSKGIKLADDYPFLPFEEYPTIVVDDCIVITSECKVIKRYLSLGDVVITFTKDGKIIYDSAW